MFPYRCAADKRYSLGRRMLPPHSLASTYSNDELFAMLRRGDGGSAYLRKCYTLTRPEFEARRVAGLSIEVSPCPSDRTAYVIAVKNAGRNHYEHVRVRYEPLLLDAENFGIDTTHMPTEAARKAGESVEFASIAPGESAQVVRRGFGPHDKYDGPRKTALDLEFQLGNMKISVDDRRWSEVAVRLPNARIEKEPRQTMTRLIALWLLCACALGVIAYNAASW